MKKIAAILLLSSAATPVLAADPIVYIPPPPAPIVVAAPSWTGLYLGGQAGYAFHGDGSGGVPGGLIRIPGTPGQDGGTEVIPVGGTVTVENSCAAAVAVVPGAGAGAGACAVQFEREGVVLRELLNPTSEQISAAAVELGAGPAEAAAAAIAVESTFVVEDGEIIVETPPIEGTDEQVINVSDLPGISRFEDDSDGFIGGVHIGYDQQLGYSFGSGALVVGAVADLSYVDIERFGGLSGFGEELSVREELDYLATLRLRVGAGFERALIYATGGLAFGEVETSFVNTLFDDFASESDTRVGYAVGGGVDFLVAPNLSLGVEYLYTDLGDGDGVSRSYDLGGGSTFEVNSDEDFDFHTVWAKASFRFN